MTEMLRVVHVLDDGSAPLDELVEKSTMEEVLILKYGDAPVVPMFKKIEGWQPDDMRSYVDASHIGGWTGKHGLEKGAGYQYGIETDDRRVVLVYKKADTKVEDPKESNTSVDTKPSQPTAPDTPTPTDSTTGDTGTVQTDTKVPTKPEESVENAGNGGKEDGTDTVGSSQTDTTGNNGGILDTNPTDSIKPLETDTILPSITSDDVVNKDETELVFPIVILDDKVDKSTSPEADNNFASDTGESQVSPVKKQTLSRVESRHLPKTSDSHNVLATLGLAILTALGLYRPNKRKT